MSNFFSDHEDFAKGTLSYNSENLEICGTEFVLEGLLNLFVFFFVAVGSEFVEEEERVVVVVIVVGVGRWRREARGGTDEGVGPTVNDLWAGGVGIVEGTRRR